jgi:quinol-cytochrome oxidoreductase complex cytochrome b subunit
MNQDSIQNVAPQKERYLKNIFLHLHPALIKKEAIEFNRTFGLGGMAVLLITVQIITGIMLRFYYEPFPDKAYDSIILMQNSVLFGQLIRNIHHWSGVFLVIIVFLHLLRVFFTGGFHSSRKVNWLIGLILFSFVIFSNFTGYLLPWDQLAYWAVTVGTSLFQYVPFFGSNLKEFLIRGNEVNADTLLIFYNLHTAVLPFLLILLMAYHFWRVRKAGGIKLPVNNNENNFVTAYPNLVFKEFIVALVLIAVILIFAVFFNAPLLSKANPNFSLNPTKAPWYFAGIQELLMHFHPLMAAFIIPVITISLIAAVPFIKFMEEPTGLWFNSELGIKSAKMSAFTAVISVPILIVINEYTPNPEILFPSLNSFISNGIIPVLILLIIIWGYFKFLMKKYKLPLFELIQAVFIFLITTFVILTITGIFFRGVDMRLTFPWNL